MVTNISSLPLQVNMPLRHLEFESIEVDIHCSEKYFGLINEIGGVFIRGIAGANAKKKEGVFGLTPNHGRVAVTVGPENTAILIKGVGWTIGGPAVFLSAKDDELCFGLYDSESARRELAVSQKLEDMGVPATRVLGYATIKNEVLAAAQFSNGKLIEPCLLFTQTISPLRVSDLTFFNLAEKIEIISKVSEIIGIPVEKYFEWFCSRLGESLGLLHENGGCNDTLDWGNITLAAEITDFEWVFVPGVPLPWGDGFDRLLERREKEVIYAFEVCTRLSYLMGGSVNTVGHDITSALKKGYQTYCQTSLAAFDNLKKFCVLGI